MNRIHQQTPDPDHLSIVDSLDYTSDTTKATMSSLFKWLHDKGSVPASRVSLGAVIATGFDIEGAAALTLTLIKMRWVVVTRANGDIIDITKEENPAMDGDTIRITPAFRPTVEEYAAALDAYCEKDGDQPNG